MSMWSQESMTKKLEWERLSRDRKPKRSLSDEYQFLKHDLATAWRKQRRRWLLEQAKLRKRRSQKSRQRHHRAH
jgi:hypothetical protein